MKLKLFLLLLSGLVLSCSSQKDKAVDDVNAEMQSSGTDVKSESFYALSLPSLDNSETIDFKSFKGKKVLLVNVASKCGYTGQYEGLESLYEQYSDKLVVLGLPCNQFMGQEPGTNEEIATFCKNTYGVKFPMTTKIDVKGKDQHLVYQWLTQKENNGVADYEVSWNFNKFLVDEEGNLVAYFGSKVKPLDSDITDYLK
jgi:glutathione peroxidase